MSNKLVISQPTSEAEKLLTAANYVYSGLEQLIKAYEMLYSSTDNKDIKKHASEQIASMITKQGLLMYPLNRVGITQAE